MTTCVCVASGPSLTVEQTQMVEAARAAGKCHVIVVNDNWRLIPNADVLYAADAKWWKYHWPAIAAGFKGECWTCDNDAAKRYGLCFIKGKGLPGISFDPALIHQNQNSGAQSVNLARHFLWQVPDDPDKQIALVGFDMCRQGEVRIGKLHWFGDHPKGFGNSARPDSWAPLFDRIYADLKSEGVRIVNCSLQTAIKSIPRADLAEVLAAL